MTTWTDQELQATANAEEWMIQTARRDGSLRDPFPVWGVQVGRDLYVRAIRGRTSPWFRAMRSRHEGRVSAGGVEKDITFVEVDDVNDKFDAAWQDKYRRYPAIVPTGLTDEARSATLRLVPRETDHIN